MSAETVGKAVADHQAALREDLAMIVDMREAMAQSWAVRIQNYRDDIEAALCSKRTKR